MSTLMKTNCDAAVAEVQPLDLSVRRSSHGFITQKLPQAADFSAKLLDTCNSLLNSVLTVIQHLSMLQYEPQTSQSQLQLLQQHLLQQMIQYSQNQLQIQEYHQKKLHQHFQLQQQELFMLLYVQHTIQPLNFVIEQKQNYLQSLQYLQLQLQIQKDLQQNLLQFLQQQPQKKFQLNQLQLHQLQHLLLVRKELYQHHYEMIWSYYSKFDILTQEKLIVLSWLSVLTPPMCALSPKESNPLLFADSSGSLPPTMVNGFGL